jgi:hypothetical protein
MRRRLGLALLALCALVLCALVVMLAAAVQSEPSVALREAITHQDVAHVRSRFCVGTIRAATCRGGWRLVRLDERDLEVLLAHGAQRWLGAANPGQPGSAGGATVQLSAHLPASPFGRWLNVELQLGRNRGSAGHRQLPGRTICRCRRLLAEAHCWAGLADRVGLSDQVRVATEVDPAGALSAAAGDWCATPGAATARAACWQRCCRPRTSSGCAPTVDRLALLTEREKPSWEVPLQRDCCCALFELARQRTAAGGDAVAAENRAALLVLTLFANGRSLDRPGAEPRAQLAQAAAACA